MPRQRRPPLVVRRGADPAAGSEATLTVPGFETWALLSLVVTLLTDATVITRRPVLVIDDGTTIFLRSLINGTYDAGFSHVCSWFVGAGHSVKAGLDGVGALPSPAIVLPGGAKIRTVTADLQAGDNYGVPVVAVYLVDALARADEQEDAWARAAAATGGDEYEEEVT